MPNPSACSPAAKRCWPKRRGASSATICYDLRFPHLYRALAKAGADFLAIPSAFTAKTGAAHWDLLRARPSIGAYVLAPAQCGLHDGGRGTWGHSMIVSPWGEVIAASAEAPGIIVATLDREKVLEARRMIPALGHDRPFEGPAATAPNEAKTEAACSARAWRLLYRLADAAPAG
jgi:predicted amidohydrolase